jgi:hypothetical protein
VIVRPYKRFHKRKRIAFVDPEGRYIDESGEILHPNELDSQYRCFCAWETARKLTIEGHGESLLWNGEHIRWRPFQFPSEDGWNARPFDAYVLRVPMYEQSEHNLREIVRWRDWLNRYRAIPGTMGGASMSLLKAKIHKPLYCSANWDVSRLRQSAGGRITNGPFGSGEYTGQLAHWDLPAAYATEIGTVRYGGRWFQSGTHRAHLDDMHRKRVPIFVRARVYVPKGLQFGPLPTRPRTPLHPFKALLLQHSGRRYPTGKTIQGIWTYEEIIVAEQVGCTVKIIEAWKHSAPMDSPFRSWWVAVQEGREMQGLAGLLAKTTGNALWGMFAMDPSLRGSTSIHYKPKGYKRIEIRKPKARPYPIPAVDLAEIVAGRVRARLYEAIATLGDRLVCAHTDGLWAMEPTTMPGDWRIKSRASEMQLLDPQRYRYWDRGKPSVTYSGVPIEQAAESFETKWGEYVEAVA